MRGAVPTPAAVAPPQATWTPEAGKGPVPHPHTGASRGSVSLADTSISIQRNTFWTSGLPSCGRPHVWPAMERVVIGTDPGLRCSEGRSSSSCALCALPHLLLRPHPLLGPAPGTPLPGPGKNPPPCSFHQRVEGPLGSCGALVTRLPEKRTWTWDLKDKSHLLKVEKHPRPAEGPGKAQRGRVFGIF